MGVIGGLVLGNPVGILLFTGLGVATGLAKLPPGVTWLQMTGVAFLCGIGFTMSLFIAGLAFEHGDTAYFGLVRLSILVGSGLSAIIGCCVLAGAFRRSRAGRRIARDAISPPG